MGLHTGEAEVRADDYVGMDVHRAARICSAAAEREGRALSFADAIAYGLEEPPA